MKPLVATTLCCLLLASGRASAQTLQLPTFQSFSTDSSVLVPDQGRATLGGMNRSASGSSQFGGLPGNRAFGAARQAGGVSVSVRIHDLDAYDRALLAEAARRRNIAVGPAQKTAELQPGTTPLAGSLAELEHAHRQAQNAAQADAAALLARGEQAEAEGKLTVARVYYQMAARQSGGGEHAKRAQAKAVALSAVLAARQPRSHARSSSTSAPRR